MCRDRAKPGGTATPQPTPQPTPRPQRVPPGSGVGVRVPGLLLHLQRGFGEQSPKPAGDVGAHVVDLVGVLAAAAGAIAVGPVGQNLHAAALAARLLPALLLRGEWWGEHSPPKPGTSQAPRVPVPTRNPHFPCAHTPQPHTCSQAPPAWLSGSKPTQSSLIPTLQGQPQVPCAPQAPG